MFRAADDAGIAWTLLAPGDHPVIDGASADTLARIEARLGEGALVLTPAAVPAAVGSRATAWWLIDPGSGLVRDEHQSGRHAAMGEYTGTNATPAIGADRFRRMMCRVGGVVVVAVGVLALGYPAGTGTATGDLVKQFGKAAELADENRRRGEFARMLACADSRVAGVRPPP